MFERGGGLQPIMITFVPIGPEKKLPFRGKIFQPWGGGGGNRGICGMAGQLARAENKDKSRFYTRVPQSEQT